jgi:hypothetical protein
MQYETERVETMGLHLSLAPSAREFRAEPAAGTNGISPFSKGTAADGRIGAGDAGHLHLLLIDRMPRSNLRAKYSRGRFVA